MDMKRITSWIIVAVLVVVAVLMGASCYMLEYSLGSQREDWTEAQAWDYLQERYPFARQWVDSVRRPGVMRDTFLTSDDGRRLHAMYLGHHGAQRTAVLVHGYGNCAIDMMQLGYMYHHDLGCNILLPDLHGHGRSDGDDIRMGWLDRLDVKRWCSVAEALWHDPIVVHGISMGAATTMMLSGEEDVPEAVTHYVEDCGYTSVEDEFRGELMAQFHLPAFPLLPVTSQICGLVYGWTFEEASSLRQVERCQRPMLFIHGDADTYVPTWMVDTLSKAHPGPKELWITPGVRHAMSYEVYPEEYTKRVANFLENYSAGK